MRRCRELSCSNGTSSGTPVPCESAASIHCETLWWTSGHSATAPWPSVSFASLSKAVGFAPVWVPSPSQAEHQPSGLLNEKLCGVSCSKLRPQRSQARCWLCRDRFPLRFRHTRLLAGHVQDAFAQRQAALDASAIRDRVPRPGHDSIDDHLHAMLPATVDLGRLLQRVRLAVDADPQVAVRLARRSTASRSPVPPRPRPEPSDRAACPRRHCADFVDDLVHRLRTDGHIAVGAMGVRQAARTGSAGSRRSR